MDLDLEGKACVITGATRGIGLATASMLAAEGARVLAVGRDGDELERTAAEYGGETLVADVTDPAAAQLVVDAARERCGGVDALVNNAGTSFERSIDDLTDDDWRDQYELHVLAPMRLMRLAAPLMAAAGGGRIVNVCSSAGKRPSQTNMAYTVTKAAQLSLSRGFADVWAAHDVLVNAIAPGPVSTGLWMEEGGLADQTAKAKGLSRAEALEVQQARVPLGRYGTPEEIAAVIAFLCGGPASNVAGAAWSVDGGTVPVII